MKTIALIMQRRIIAQRLKDAFSSARGYSVLEVPYEQAERLLSSYGQCVVLIEVEESGVHDVLYCLELCRQLEVVAPDSIRLLMVPEKENEAVHAAIHAKREGLIQDFLFFDNPLSYVVAKLKTWA